jgi:hypothetical protein
VPFPLRPSIRQHDSVSNRRRLKQSRSRRPDPGGEDPKRSPLANAIAPDAARIRRENPVGYRRYQFVLRLVLGGAILAILVLAALHW